MINTVHFSVIMFMIPLNKRNMNNEVQEQKLPKRFLSLYYFFHEVMEMLIDGITPGVKIPLQLYSYSSSCLFTQFYYINDIFLISLSYYGKNVFRRIGYFMLFYNVKLLQN